MSSSTPTHSLISIQKAPPSSSSSSPSAGKSKRLVLPKADLIQFYIENSDHHHQQQSKSPTSSSPAGQATAGGGGKCRVLPKFNNQDVIKHLNFSPKPTTASVAALAPSLSTIARTLTMVNASEPDFKSLVSTTSPCRGGSAKQLSAQSKKCEKEKKFKEITRLCLNHSTHSAHQITNSAWLEQDASISHLNGHSSLANPAATSQATGQGPVADQNSEIRQLVKHLAREFLVDCRQRLDNDSFTRLLNTLCSVKKESSLSASENDPMDVESEQSSEEDAALMDIFKLIRNDKNLLNKFSAFLTCERALRFDLFPQTCQYEKCYDFFHKIELFVPNKLTFKKLMQSIISNCNFSSEFDTTATKIEEIKTKLKSVAKNNALINFELDYLFDQRRTNLEPTYEKVSLVNLDPSNEEGGLTPAQPLPGSTLLSTNVNGVPNLASASTIPVSSLLESFPANESNRKFYEKYLDNEFIDLTGEYPANYGTKKCSCACHSTCSPNQTVPGSVTEPVDDKSAPSSGPTFHCLACSLKILKGKLCIKCEGKKAVPLVYKIRD